MTQRDRICTAEEIQLVQGMKESFLYMSTLSLTFHLPRYWWSCSIPPEAFHRYILLWLIFTTHAFIDPLPKIAFIPLVLHVCSKQVNYETGPDPHKCKDIIMFGIDLLTETT